MALVAFSVTAAIGITGLVVYLVFRQNIVSKCQADAIALNRLNTENTGGVSLLRNTLDTDIELVLSAESVPINLKSIVACPKLKFSILLSQNSERFEVAKRLLVEFYGDNVNFLYQSKPQQSLVFDTAQLAPTVIFPLSISNLLRGGVRQSSDFSIFASVNLRDYFQVDKSVWNQFQGSARAEEWKASLGLLFQVPGSSQVYIFNFSRERKGELMPLVKLEENQVALPKTSKGSTTFLDIELRDNQVSRACIVPTAMSGVYGIVLVPISAIDEKLSPLVINLGYLGGLLALFSLVLSFAVARVIVSPVIAIKNVLNQLRRGKIPPVIATKEQPGNEILEISAGLNTVIGALSKTSEYAVAIGRGDFNASYALLSNEDQMGVSLIGMKDSLMKARQLETEKLLLGQVKSVLSELFTSNPDNFADWQTEISTYLSQLDGVNMPLVEIEVNLGSEYQKQDNLKLQSQLLDKSPNKLFKVGDIEAQGYFYIKTETYLLGRLKCLSTTSQPLENQILSLISETLARPWQGLLYRTQQEELLAQILEKNKLFKEQNTALELSQKRFQVLLENATEVISIYNADMTLRLVSPSVYTILGYKPDELIGVQDSFLLEWTDRGVFVDRHKRALEGHLMEKPLRLTYLSKSGSKVILESTITLIKDEGSQTSVLLNARDVTSEITAEKERRLRSEMQSLSENSKDLILRINLEGTIYFANAASKQAIGKGKDDFVIENTALETWISKDASLSYYIHDLATTTLSNGETQIRVVAVKDEIKVSYYQITSIPERDDFGMLESVLVVAHDVTHQKEIEFHLASINQKITESIDYAQRIQAAILPDMTVLKSFIKDSFLIYEPKDIVSGDFPWFYAKGHTIYIGVVDCTGHGVPGALLSVLGNFLLKEAIKSLDSPGHILTQLDASLSFTLRTDYSTGISSDGMDLSLIKIDLKEQSLVYAGAHRPLVIHRGGKVNVIKGDKFQIGSMQGYGADHYQDFVLPYTSGDTLLVFSDGYPDQFGGPEDKKITTKRVCDILAQNASLSTEELGHLYTRFFHDWKGNGKQTDDVLMIGLKLP